jgi:hypothetical protein
VQRRNLGKGTVTLTLGGDIYSEFDLSLDLIVQEKPFINATIFLSVWIGEEDDSRPVWDVLAAKGALAASQMTRCASLMLCDHHTAAQTLCFYRPWSDCFRGGASVGPVSIVFPDKRER